MRLSSLRIAALLLLLATAGFSWPWQSGGESTGSLKVARRGHAATLLQDGRVLVAGGFNDRDGALDSVELWIPVGGLLRSGQWISTEPMGQPRVGLTATTLADGRVLVVGGADGDPELSDPNHATASAEIWEPVNQLWRPAATMMWKRVGHTATLLPDGRVFVLGGAKERSSPPDSSTAEPTAEPTAEIYDPHTDRWQPEPLAENPILHSVTLIDRGIALVIAGAGPFFYQPGTARREEAGSFEPFRQSQAVAVTGEGLILVSGGREVGAGKILGTTQVWVPSAGEWQQADDLNHPRHRHTATAVLRGGVLVTGGLPEGDVSSKELHAVAQVELWNPEDGSWKSLGKLRDRRYRHTATPLQNGWVLLTGGASRPNNANDRLNSLRWKKAAPNPTLSSAELWRPE